jgi:hypothetical protein
MESVLWIRTRIRMFLDLKDPDPLVEVRIRILLSSSKIENLDFYCFATSYDFLSLKTDVNGTYLQKVKSKKTY